MTASWRARCRICPWHAKGAGPATLGDDALSAHVAVVHRRAS